jgi:hypothetical protein
LQRLKNVPSNFRNKELLGRIRRMKAALLLQSVYRGRLSRRITSICKHGHRARCSSQLIFFNSTKAQTGEAYRRRCGEKDSATLSSREENHSILETVAEPRPQEGQTDHRQPENKQGQDEDSNGRRHDPKNLERYASILWREFPKLIIVAGHHERRRLYASNPIVAIRLTQLGLRILSQMASIKLFVIAQPYCRIWIARTIMGIRPGRLDDDYDGGQVLV